MKDEVETSVTGDGTTASAVPVTEVMNLASLGFIGCGNMAQAMLAAFIKKGVCVCVFISCLVIHSTLFQFNLVQ